MSAGAFVIVSLVFGPLVLAALTLWYCDRCARRKVKT